MFKFDPEKHEIIDAGTIHRATTLLVEARRLAGDDLHDVARMLLDTYLLMCGIVSADGEDKDMQERLFRKLADAGANYLSRAQAIVLIPNVEAIDPKSVN